MGWVVSGAGPSVAWFYSDQTLGAIITDASESNRLGYTYLGQDNQPGLAYDSMMPLFLQAGTRYRVVVIVGGGSYASGSGQIQLLTGGRLEEVFVSGLGRIQARGEHIVNTVSVSYAGGTNCQVVDLGDFVCRGWDSMTDAASSGLISAFTNRCTGWLVLRWNGGLEISSVGIMPNCTPVDVAPYCTTGAIDAPGGYTTSAQIGMAGVGDPTVNSLSTPTYWDAMTVPCPITADSVSIYCTASNSPPRTDESFALDFILLSTQGTNGYMVDAGNDNPGDFYGGVHQWNFDTVTKLTQPFAAGDTITWKAEQFYGSSNVAGGGRAWYSDPAFAYVDRWFFSYPSPCGGGPPIINTQHRAYLADEGTS